ncbi:protein AF-10 isoform X2 [Ixodes scapularis]|uniref:protein AF-10 isoform X2 n=1 Tax=Ixodes scapularis TaxID=6945 RepID=UPI001A9FB836|nr:protein AF-10 isoform X2 [Ixodes scapularis]
MKEMVGGCCVCSDERGWAENPLVYCDGQGCNVAVHQACYGIVQVPTGPWFCRKCESQERCARVRCELCPSRDGALKRTDNGGWAHVVCALYIPEVRFGNVTTMEPIVLQLVPQDRFSKTCFICEQQRHESKASIGACMQCNKSGCKQYFHVTCAQAAGLLCEEAGNYMDNVKYCGYCPYHYQKLKRDSNIKIIPAFKPIPADCEDSQEASPERKPAATTGRARMKGATPQEKRALSRQATNGGAASSDGGASSDATEPRNGASDGSSPSSGAGNNTPASTTSTTAPLPLPGKFTTANFTEAAVVQTGSPVFGSCERQRKRGRPSQQQNREAKSSAAPLQAKLEPASPPPTSGGIGSNSNSSNPTPSFSSIYENLVGSGRPDKKPKAKRAATSASGAPSRAGSSAGEATKNGSGKRGSSGASPTPGVRLRKRAAPPTLSPSDRPSAATPGAANGLPPLGGGDVDHTYYRELSLGGEEGSPRPGSADSALTQPARLSLESADDATLETSPHPRPDEADDKGAAAMLTLGAGPETWASAPSAHVGPPRTPSLPPQRDSPAWPPPDCPPPSMAGLFPQTLEQLLERQWDQGSSFLMKQAQHFDIASLLSCLHQLRSENLELETRISGLQARRDQLLAVSARLLGPLGTLAAAAGTAGPLSTQGSSSAEAAATAAVDLRAGLNPSALPGGPMGTVCFPGALPTSQGLSQFALGSCQTPEGHASQSLQVPTSLPLGAMTQSSTDQMEGTGRTIGLTFGDLSHNRTGPSPATPSQRPFLGKPLRDGSHHRGGGGGLAATAAPSSLSPPERSGCGPSQGKR